MSVVLRQRARTLLISTVAAGAVTALLAGCSSAPGAAQSGSTTAAPTTAATAPQTRTVEQPLGTVVIPADPERVVALDEYAALELLAVGVEPDVVYASLQSTTASHALSPVEGLEVVDAPTFLASPDLEGLAARKADVMVMSGTGPLVAQYAALSEVAPVVAVPNTGWREALAATAAAFGTEDRAAAVTKALEDKFAEVSAKAASIGSVSVLFGFQGALYSPAGNAPLSGELADAGITRIPVEAQTRASTEADNIIPVSPEALPDHAADLTILLDAGYYEASTVLEAPTSPGGRSAKVDGDAWFGQHPFGVFWVLEDLELLLGGADAGATADQAGDRWSEFTALVGP